jgi:phosphonopyruvate decarboxylase
VVAETPGEVASEVARMQAIPGPAFLEVRVNKGARDDLGRPQGSPRENREALMQNLGS